MNVRPHPSPLSEERENFSPATKNSGNAGLLVTAHEKPNGRRRAIRNTKLSDPVAMLSLSPGERVEMRILLTESLRFEPLNRSVAFTPLRDPRFQCVRALKRRERRAPTVRFMMRASVTTHLVQ
jgi:hypothetical protein